jgi:hypothetical protein
MADSSLAANSIRLLEVLNQDVVLRCPLFQRGFTWGKAEIDQLWNDIDTLRDGQYEVRFLGALVFDADQEARASYAPTKWIIDGQQRLTTLYLSLVVIAEMLDATGVHSNEADDLIDEFLVGRKKNVRRSPKLVPTIPDQAQMDVVLDGLRDHEVERLTPVQLGTSGDLTAGFGIVRRCVSERVTAVDPEDRHEQLVELRDVLLERLEFVEIILGDNHDANEVFDRLNKSGQPLTLLDLIRNDVMRWSMKEPETAQRLYDNEWFPFEQGFSDKSRESYFFPFALTVNPSISKSRTFHVLVDHWRNLIDQLGGDASSEIRTKAVIADLRTHQPAYLALAEAKLPDELDTKSPLWQSILCLYRSRFPGVMMPYLMQAVTAALDGEADPLEVTSCFRLVESFHVRRAVVGMEPTGLHAIFKRLWKDVGTDVGALRNGLTSRTITFPNDSEFHEALTRGNLYNRNICRYVLAERERSIETGDVLAQLPEFEVDHILPQHPDPDSTWWDWWDEAEHESLVNTFANLTPMTKSGNSEKSNRDWTDVREWLRGNTAFKQTSDVYLMYDTWTPQDVLRRAGELANWALDRWP